MGSKNTPKHAMHWAFPTQLRTAACLSVNRTHLFTVFRTSIPTVIHLMHSKIIWCTEYLAILQSQTTLYCVMLLEEGSCVDMPIPGTELITRWRFWIQIPWNLCTADPELKLPRISSQYIEHLLVSNWNFESKLPTNYPCYFIDPIWLFVTYSNIAIYCT